MVSLIVAIIAFGSTVLMLMTRPVEPSRQLEEVLPFGSQIAARGVDVDSAGAIYVVDAMNTDEHQGRVLKLAPTSSTPQTLPFPPLENAVGLAMDDADTVFVADSGADAVYRLKPGETGATEVPFTDLVAPGYLAVDNEGTLYVVETTRRAVRTYSRSGEETTYSAVTDKKQFWNGIAVKEPGVIVAALFVQAPSAEGSTISDPRVTEINLRTGLKRDLAMPGLHTPTGITYDSVGNLYVGNDFGEFSNVLLHTLEGSTYVVPFAGGVKPEDLAVAPNGSLLLTNTTHVRRLSNFDLGGDG